MILRQLAKMVIATAICFCTFYHSAFTQVVINEYSASNLNGFLDNYERTEDWIELYNTTNVSFDIGGWHLSDKENNPGKWKIPEGTSIPANGYLIFWCSGRDEASNGHFHTNFKLTQTKGNEFVVLSDENAQILESYALAITLVEHSRCRSEDGGDDWEVCTEPTLKASNNDSPQFAAYTLAPTFDIEAGYYDGPVTVTITNNQIFSRVHYTLDGTTPTEDSPEYEEPILIEETRVLKAKSFSQNPQIIPGKETFSTYFINEAFTLAVFSVAADDVQDLANGEGELIPIGSLEYFNLEQDREAIAFGSLNRHGQDSWVLDHRSLDWVSRDEMGYTKAVLAPLFSYSERDEYQKFMFRNSGDDNYPAIDDGDHEGSTHIRDEYVQELSREFGMELDTRAVERVIVFLNGDYWGVYGMRERPVDHDYTKEYYKQGKYDIQYLSTWGNTEIEYGGPQAQEDWENIRDFILDNDMSIADNYQIADDSIKLLSLIDYMIVNLTVVASDWLNYNTGWWRGLDPDGKHKKWGYILWDLDATFDYYINYSGVPNTNPDADPCDLEEIGEYMDEFFGVELNLDLTDCPSILDGSCPYDPEDPSLQAVVDWNPSCCDNWSGQCQNGYNWVSNGGGGGLPDVGKHEKIFFKLLEESEVFKQLYYSRYADLMNTVYTCDNMITTLERMLDVIDPEMPGQIARWGGTYAEWQSNVQDLKDFINERCTLLDDGMLECYPELNGPYPITLKTIPDGIGEIDFNTLDVREFPWTGEYFGGMDQIIKARVLDEHLDDYVFSHWESATGNVILDTENFLTTMALTQEDTLTAIFSEVTNLESRDDVFYANLSPNPAKDQVLLRYELENSQDVSISLYSVVGQKVMDFQAASGWKAAGKQVASLEWSSEQVPAGLYLLQLEANGKQHTLKLNITQ